MIGKPVDFGLFYKYSLSFIKYNHLSAGSICFNCRCITYLLCSVGNSIDFKMRSTYHTFQTLGCSSWIKHIETNGWEFFCHQVLVNFTAFVIGCISFCSRCAFRRCLRFFSLHVIDCIIINTREYNIH